MSRAGHGGNTFSGTRWATSQFAQGAHNWIFCLAKICTNVFYKALVLEYFHMICGIMMIETLPLSRTHLKTHLFRGAFS